MWPFRRREVRAAESYSDRIVAAMLAAATGQAVDPSSVAAVEAARSLMARAFASAAVTPATGPAMALTPSALAQIGASLVWPGELIFDLRARRGRAVLEPASAWDITGGPDPASWRYKLTMAGPSRSTTITRPSQGVLHIKALTAPATPWKGESPLHRAKTTARLAAVLEDNLAKEASWPPIRVMGLPAGDTPETALALREAMKEASDLGRIAAVGAHGGASQGGGYIEPRQHRFGIATPDSAVSLRSDAALAVLAACGIPPALVMEGDGGAQRESWRRFLHGCVSPMAAVVMEEARAKLDAGLALNFDSLMASDLSGRARAFASMVQSGMDLTQAAALAGLIEAAE